MASFKLDVELRHKHNYHEVIGSFDSQYFVNIGKA